MTATAFALTGVHPSEVSVTCRAPGSGHFGTGAEEPETTARRLSGHEGPAPADGV
ncbi:hypothetical protein ACFVW8_08150 [Streptomyces sp. NPDC058221]|uniref:hypothetical protein n=1 Tax=Streptomyces sp. NPDC058221 TaxID=3346388 RepID=UPI0036E27DE1